MPNILIITTIGAGLSLPIFLLYYAICQHITGEKIIKLFSSETFKNNFIPFILITTIYIIIINFLFFKFGYGLKFIAVCAFAYMMLLLAAIDFKTQMLPDIITKPLIALGLLQGYFGIFTDFQSSALGAILGYLVLWSVNLCFRLAKGMDGMGYGDFKLLSAISAWTGIKLLPLTILLSSVVGIFVALVIIKLTKSDLNAPTPFGPTLVFTGLLAILYGNDIINLYLMLITD